MSTSSFFFNHPKIHCMGISLFYLSIHQLIKGCFEVSSLMISAAFNVCVQVFMWIYVFNSFGYISRKLITMNNDKWLNIEVTF